MKTIENELTEKFEYFKKGDGRVRISLTSNCNARCWFCHNEGATPPVKFNGKDMVPKKQLFNTQDYINLVDNLIQLGVKVIYFTGGEALLSPHLEPILDSIPPHSTDDYNIVLATNGVFFEEKYEMLSRMHIDKLKVSLHAFTNETLYKIEKLKCIDKIKNAIKLAKSIIPHVEINTLLMPENQHEIFDIIGFAEEVGVPIKILELVWTDHNNSESRKMLSTKDVADALIARGGKARIESRGIGVNLRVIDMNEHTSIRMMDETIGRTHVGKCETCDVRPFCVEGFYAIRVDPEGFALPCLLRNDLKLDLKELEKESLKEVLPRWIGSFMNGTDMPETNIKILK
ncbi:radical SAM protein [Paenibacillus kobensis]|uniref:radical SAM protein n=1 Tax=Paenibacillus kobensis TaxID=59841 RepID=UPI000FDCDAC8|nr:radical SAM protein [Paenibacillus kobensis]